MVTTQEIRAILPNSIVKNHRKTRKSKLGSRLRHPRRRASRTFVFSPFILHAGDSLYKGKPFFGFSAAYDMMEKIDLEGATLKSIIFDLDGTLWDATAPIAKAWNIIFKETDLPQTDAETVRGLCGLPMDEIMDRLQPSCSMEEHLDALYQIEEDIIREEGAHFYHDVRSLFRELAPCYELYIVSNCQDGYIQLFLETSGLVDVVKDFECWGRTGLSKGENIRLVMARNQVEDAVYVGDTLGDEKAARDAEVPFYYAAYGFGEAKAPDVHLSNINKIKEYFPCPSNASKPI